MKLYYYEYEGRETPRHTGNSWILKSEVYDGFFLETEFGVNVFGYDYDKVFTSVEEFKKYVTSLGARNIVLEQL